MIVDMSPGHRISPSKGGATWQVTITKSAIPKEKTLAGVCLSLLGASPLVPTDTPPPFSSRLSRCSHLDCRAAIEPHIPVFDHSARSDGMFERSDFAFDHRRDHYTCPAGKQLRRARRSDAVKRDSPSADGFYRYRASKLDCDGCALKPRCCPGADARKIMRSVHEGARDLARKIAQEDEWITSRRERKKVEMLFTHLKRILRLDRLRLRGPNGARDEFHLAAAAQNLRKMAKIIPMPRPAMA
jgi:hypothetical protein